MDDLLDTLTTDGPGDIIGNQQVHVFTLCLVQTGIAPPGGMEKINYVITTNDDRLHILP